MRGTCSSVGYVRIFLNKNVTSLRSTTLAVYRVHFVLLSVFV